MQWAQALDKGPWLQMYTVPGNCMPLGRQTTEGSPSQTWQAGDGSFLLLGWGHPTLSIAGGCELSTTTGLKTAWKKFKELLPEFSLHTTSLSRHVAVCTALVCGAQCSMPVRLSHWENQTSNVCSRLTGQWSDRSATSGARGCHNQVQWATCAAWH